MIRILLSVQWTEVNESVSTVFLKKTMTVKFSIHVSMVIS